MNQLPKPKAVNYELITENEHPEMYDLLARVRRFHSDIGEAEIGLAWRKGWKVNPDGLLVLGKCVKTSDLQREFSDYDFVIVLNREVWTNPDWTEKHKLALLDHELCHATVAVDDEDDTKYNERSRPVYRIRKHDIEEFQEVVERHGCYKRDLQLFASSIMAGEPSLFDEPIPEVETAAAAQ